MPDEWFVSTTSRPNAIMAVAAFPAAGGGCSAFARHARVMPDWLDLITLNLPGRQARFGQPARTEINGLAKELAEYLSNYPKPFLFFGYCSGSVLAYRVACDLVDGGVTRPERLVVGSYGAPHLGSPELIADLDSDALWEVLSASNAVPPQFRDHPDLRSFGEAAVRGDMKLTASYQHTVREPLPIPITVIAGEKDSWISSDVISAWRGYTSQDFDVRYLPAGHWFMEEDVATSAASIVVAAELVLNRLAEGKNFDDCRTVDRGY
jgi:medium-chain acyl-[acyl-carrier-protein] hydrolase